MGPSHPHRTRAFRDTSVRYLARLHYSALIVRCTPQREPSEVELQTAIAAAQSLLTMSVDASE